MSRRSQRLALQDPALHVLVPLFPELSSLVFAKLPVDSRLRCREVCRGWRAFLADVRFLQVCDLGLSSGVARRTPALLRAASERARGTLRELDVSGWYRMPVGEGEETLDDEQLLPVLRANAASLLTLRTWKLNVSVGLTSADTIEQLITAAPRLRLLECDSLLQGDEAQGPVPRLLREPQFAPLRLGTLSISGLNVQPPVDMPALAAWAAMQPSLKRLILIFVPLSSQPAQDALLSLTVMRLEILALFSCRLEPAVLPSLARMLRSLQMLVITNFDAPLLVGASVLAFCTELRASRLVMLYLDQMSLWHSLDDGLAVIAACTGHPTLHTISFAYNGLENAPGRVAIEAALDALQASIPRLALTR